MSLAAVSVSPVLAAPVQDEAATQEAGKQLEMGIHYILVARPDLAAQNIRAALDGIAEDEMLADLLLEQNLDARLEDAIRRGRRMAGVSDIITELESRVEAGRLLAARNQVRIDAAVAALAGSGRQQVLARERLMAAGEYAASALFPAAMDQSNPALSVAAREMLVKLGRMCVAPLCGVVGGAAAPDSKLFAAEVLGEVAWPSAEPYLLQLSEDTTVPSDVREAAASAYRRCGGGAGSAADQFAGLARQYFNELPSVIPYPDDAVNTLWSFDASTGLLVPDAVDTETFGSVMAKRLAARALEIDPQTRGALVTFVAADLRAAIRSGGADMGSDGGEVAGEGAEFFARLAGLENATGVLELSLQAGDAPLVLTALQAIRAIGGGANIVSSQPTPLSKALVYPERRVQFETALVLAEADPRINFMNASFVVPRIAAMLQPVPSSVGAIVSADDEGARALASELLAAGFEPGTAVPSFAHYAGNHSAFGGMVDFFVIAGDRSFVEREFGDLRANGAFGASPVLLLVSSVDASALGHAVEGDRRTVVSEAGAGTAALQFSLTTLLAEAAGGAFTEDEAATARARAIEALRAIGMRASGQFTLVDAMPQLTAATQSTDDILAMDVAGIMALVPEPSAQTILFDQALARTGDARVTFLFAVAEHARRSGTFLDAKRVQALLTLVQSSAGDEAVAAGAAYGALGLPGAEAVHLITRPR
ncbi:MAG: hypothetical protein O2855_02845 [Planctomycetota bacterium]|nr:hypothetical protein [Planctomycetota bacterium]